MKNITSLKKVALIVSSLIIVSCAAALVIKPDAYVKSSLEGIKLWALVVLPSLLPFFFLTALASSLGLVTKLSSALEKPASAIFRCGGTCSFVFIMSVLSGYPVGAKIISDLYKKGETDSDEATRMSCFCSTSGPMFIVGSVGIGMFGDKRAGFILLFSHILSALVAGVIFRFYGKKTERRTLKKSLVTADNILYDCVYSSVISVAVVGGFICVFYVLADMAGDAGIFNLLSFPLGSLFGKDVATAFSSGLIECTRGCLALSKCGLSTYSVAFASALISFGGVSVIFQSLAFLSSAKVNTLVFLSSKIIQTVVSFLIATTACSLLL
ncbi:MAG: hypothetical protein IJS67_02325 [Clostridia bacterium]|nr:hypothetical protein [Clostridia bacterium]